MSIAAWWRKRWVPAAELEEARRHETTERLARMDIQERLARHIEASTLVRAKAVSGDFASDPRRYGVQGARRLRLEIVIDDRVLLDYSGQGTFVRDAIAEEAAWKMKQAVLALDFALAGTIMREDPRVPPR